MLLYQFTVQLLCGQKQSWKSASNCLQDRGQTLQHAMSVFIRWLHLLPSSPFSTSPTYPSFSLPYHVPPTLHSHWTSGSFPGTPCVSTALPFAHSIPYTCNALPCFSLQEGVTGPWKPSSFGISTVKSF